MVCGITGGDILIKQTFTSECKSSIEDAEDALKKLKQDSINYQQLSSDVIESEDGGFQAILNRICKI
jgi:hypothetical protein